jgi:hypothetical protein
MNPAPDMDVNSLSKPHFDWLVAHMADMAIRLAKSTEETRSRYYWGQMVAPKSATTVTTKTPKDVAAKANANTKAATAKTAAPESKPKTTRAKKQPPKTGE